MVAFPTVVQSIDPLLTQSEQMPLFPNSKATELSTFPGGEPEYYWVSVERELFHWLTASVMFCALPLSS